MDKNELREALTEDREITASRKGIGCLAVPVTAIIGAAIGGWAGFFVFLVLTGAAMAAMEQIVKSNFEAKRKRNSTRPAAEYTRPAAVVRDMDPAPGQAHIDVNNPANWSYTPQQSGSRSNLLVNAQPQMAQASLPSAATLSVQADSQQSNRVPVMTPAMITPIDKPLTTTEATKVLRAFLAGHSNLQSSVQALVVDAFADEVRDAIDELTEHVSWAEDAANDAQAEVATQKEAVAKARTIADKEERDHEVEYELEILRAAKTELARVKAEVSARRAKLAAFKTDKREFLIAYTNNRLHDIPMSPLDTDA